MVLYDERTENLEVKYSDELRWSWTCGRTNIAD